MYKLDPEHEIKAVDRVLNWTGTGTFESNYTDSTSYDAKFQVAIALIKDGRYKNLHLLDKSFATEPAINSDPKIKEMKDRIRVALMEKGVIDPISPEAAEASAELTRFIDRNEMLSELRDVLPIDVMGAITTVERFEHATDEQMREKLRSWTTKALLRDYLGTLLVHRPKGEIDYHDLVTRSPEKVFENPDSVIYNIYRRYLESKILRTFNPGEAQGFTELDTDIADQPGGVKKQMLIEIRQKFQAVAELPISPAFKTSVESWTGEASIFPNFRQKYVVREFQKTKRKLLNGDTGATKTACAYLAMEANSADKVTIFGPPRARNTWPKEATVVFNNEAHPDVFTIRSAKDLKDSRVVNAKYVYLGSALMGKAWKDANLFRTIRENLVIKRQTDGVIIDEADEFRHKKTGRSQVISELITEMEADHAKRSKERMPMVALTATPISSSLEDLDIPMALLYPERFCLPGRENNGKCTFNVQILKDPEIAYSLLFGEQLILQWSLEDLFGERIPQVDNRIVNLDLSPFEQVLNTWISELPAESLVKIRLLQSLLLNPELVKKTCRERGFVPEGKYSDVEALRKHLTELHTTWISWMLNKNGGIPDEPFSADWIAKIGDTDFLLQCFFEPGLIEDVETLARTTPQIGKDWQHREAVSTKFAHIRDLIRKHVARDQDGNYHADAKIFIAVPGHKRGITRWLEDPETTDKDLLDNIWSLYEYLLSDWLPGLPRDKAVNIDGSVPFNKRDKHAVTWGTSGEKDIVVVSSMESVYESMNWSVRKTPDNQNIKKVVLVLTSWPFGYDEMKQFHGRFPRPGQVVPIESEILQTNNSIDVGMADLVKMKYLLTQVALSRIQLTPEEREFFTRATSAKRILLEYPTVGETFVRDTINRLKGAGETEIAEKLGKLINGKNGFEIFAKEYYANGSDENRTVGLNWELMKNLGLESQPEDILVVGAGSCGFARKLIKTDYKAKIDNLDINGAILRQAKEKYPEIGQVISGRASDTKLESLHYDLTECGFMLPWTKLYESKSRLPKNPQEIERVKILSEINRVTKNGGTVLLSFPESSLTPELFANYANCLTTHFGFSLEEPSGKTFTTDIDPNKPIGWVLKLRKVDSPNLSGIDAGQLAFTSDEETKISRRKKRKEGKTQVVVLDPPLFSARHFRVFNPLTGQETISDSLAASRCADQPIVETAPAEAIKAAIKNDDLTTQREMWVDARRQIQKTLRKNYEEAEEILADIFSRNGLAEPNNWPTEGSERDKIDKTIKIEIGRLSRIKMRG